jgi:uncharacterized membrane protein YsdA (DUF1294 family)
MTEIFKIAIIAFGALNLLTFIVYGADKLFAINGTRRVPEKILLALSIIGGGVGGSVAMELFRHKTRREHWYFRAINLVGIAVLVFALYYAWNF